MTDLSLEAFFFALPSPERENQDTQWGAAPRLVACSASLWLHPRRDLTQWRRWWCWSRDSLLCGAAVAASSECTRCSWHPESPLPGWGHLPHGDGPGREFFTCSSPSPRDVLSTQGPRLDALGRCHPTAVTARQSEPCGPAQWPRLRLPGRAGARRLGKRSERLRQAPCRAPALLHGFKCCFWSSCFRGC